MRLSEEEEKKKRGEKGSKKESRKAGLQVKGRKQPAASSRVKRRGVGKR